MPEDKLSAQHHQVVDTYHDPFADYEMTPRDTILRPYTVGESITITLPNVSECAGRFYSIIAGAIVSPFTITIQDSGESVEWTDIILADTGRSYLLFSDGLSWITQNTELFRHKTSSRTIGVDILSHIHLTQDAVVIGTGQTEVFRAELTSDVKTGAWANALVGSINYSSTGAAHGMAAAVAAEMIPPDGSLSRGALFCADFAMGPGDSSSWGSAGPVAFMNFQNWGTQAYFDDNAYWFRMARVLEDTDNMLSLNANTLRVRFDGNVAGKERFVVMSNTQNIIEFAHTETSIILVNTFTGAAAIHAQNITVNDATATTGGDAAGLHLGVTYTGDHTGTGWKTAIAIDYQITGNNAYGFAQSIWIGDCGDAVINYLVGQYIYMEDVGGSATVAYSYNLSLNQNAANATYAGFIRVYGHSGTTHSVIHFANNAGTTITNFLHFEGLASPLTANAGTAAAADGYIIACDIGGVTYYLKAATGWA
jgi:hypothetical protein